MTHPKKPLGRPYLKNPHLPRGDGEKIGGGFFVFRRGDHTGRIRPAPWPFEHPTYDSAVTEAERLAELQPGYQFDVLYVVQTVRVLASVQEVA